MMKKNIVMVLILVAVLLSASCSTSSPTVSQPTADPALQAKRLALIQEGIDRGIFYKFNENSVWVKPLFMTLSFDDKQTFVGLVYAYCNGNNPKLDRVFVYDYSTNKIIGSFDIAGGLSLH
jgi:hypothetical protein